MQLKKSASGETGRPALALVTLVPLIWLLAVTMTAGVQKVFDPSPRIGFLAAARGLDEALPQLESAASSAAADGKIELIGAARAVHDNRVLHFNNIVDAVVTCFFLLMVVLIVAVSVYEWLMLLAGKRPATLSETEPVWLPEYAVAESKPANLAGAAALGLALARELSGESRLERAQQLATNCQCETGKVDLLGIAKAKCGKTPEEIYVQVTEERFDKVTRCC